MASQPTVVDYWANWCMPCRQLEPHLERLAAKHRNDVAIWKLDVGWDALPRRRYEFHAVPTMIMYFRGREVARQIGMPARDTDLELERFIQRGLAAIK